MKSILVVDDNTFVAEALALRLGLFIRDSRIITAADGREAARILDSEPVDFLLTDLQMPVMDGYDLILYCRKNHPRVHLCAMTAGPTADVLRRLRMLGVTVCFSKPFDFDETAQRVRDELVSGRGVLDTVTGRIAAALYAVRGQ